MSTSLRHITFDVHDPHLLARFWADVLGYGEHPDNPNLPDDTECLIIDPAGLGPGLLFVTVPDVKVVKNRVHLDVVPDQPRDAEVERVLGLGATLVADHRRPDGSGWAVLADPEGNEFCVERSAAERGDPPPIDTGERLLPPVRTADEPALLTGLLEWYREGVIAKVDGVSAAHAAAAPLRSATTIAGLVKHLALVEDSWFHHRFAGHPEPEPWASAPWDDDPDWEFTTAAVEPLASSLALYRAACERSRRAVAGRDLDDLAAPSEGRQFDLRFAEVHLIEETARHLGHLDILRELLDGTRGE